MSDYFDRIEAHLLDAVERHASSRAPRRGGGLADLSRWSGRRTLNPSTVLVAVLVIVSVAVAAVFLTSVHSAEPPRPATQPANPLADHACGNAAARQLSRTAPPESLLSILGVLRRSQTSKDVLPERSVPRPLRAGATNVFLGWAAVRYHNGKRSRPRTIDGTIYQYSKYVRLARTFAGGRYYLIPLAAVANIAGGHRCSRPYFAGLSLYTFREGTGFGGGFYTTSEILSGHASDESSAGGQTFLTFLVPDRVASVTVYFSPGQGSSTTIRTRPVGNVVSVILPLSSLRAPFRVHSVWHSASGRIIKPSR